jgi:hypothetical protein
MHADAPLHPRRRPLNWQADDVQRALAHRARPLRDVVEHYRSRVLAQEQRIERGMQALMRNPRDRSAINPLVERDKLLLMREVLHHLLHSLEQIENTPTAAECGPEDDAT